MIARYREMGSRNKKTGKLISNDKMEYTVVLVQPGLSGHMRSVNI